MHVYCFRCRLIKMNLKKCAHALHEHVHIQSFSSQLNRCRCTHTRLHTHTSTSLCDPGQKLLPSVIWISSKRLNMSGHLPQSDQTERRFPLRHSTSVLPSLALASPPSPFTSALYSFGGKHTYDHPTICMWGKILQQSRSHGARN